MDVSHEIIRSLGMAMIHSLWQGAIVSALMLLFLGLTGKTNARYRYGILFSGLMILLIGFIATFILIFKESQLKMAGFSPSLAALLDSEPTVLHAWSFSPAQFAAMIFGSLEPFYIPLAVGWLVGFTLTGVRLTGVLFLTHLSLRRELMWPSESLELIFSRVQDKLNMRAVASLRMTPRRISPMVLGIIKPMVIIPVAAVTGLGTSQVEAVMMHELAHIRRYDHVLVIVQAIAGQILFFHPLTWYLMREIDRERENACDDMVLQKNANPINYIKALTMIQEMNLNSPVTGNALTGKPKQLLRRVTRLLKPEVKHSPAFRLAVILLFFATVGVSAMTLMITGKPEPRAPSSETIASTAFPELMQQDASGRLIRQGTLQTTLTGDDGGKKKVKVVFVNDTIREMTVNGKEVTKEEMKHYQEDLQKIEQEMDNSRRELEEANRQLAEMQQELQKVMPEYWRSEEFREQMRKSREEARRALEEFRLQHREVWEQQREQWFQHRVELQEQFRKVQEEARKAMEEWQKNMGDQFHPEFEIPDVPEIEVPEIPDVEIMMPEIPEEPAEMLEEEPLPEEKQAPEPMDEKLRELEEE